MPCLQKEKIRSTKLLISFSITYVFPYARSTLPERRHLEHTWMWHGVPFTMALTRCTLGFQVLLEALWEWETLLPKVTPLPQTAHFAIQNTSFNLCRNTHAIYYSRFFRKKQVFFQIFFKKISRAPAAPHRSSVKTGQKNDFHKFFRKSPCNEAAFVV